MEKEIFQVKIDMLISGSALRAEGRRPKARRVEVNFSTGCKPDAFEPTLCYIASINR